MASDESISASVVSMTWLNELGMFCLPRMQTYLKLGPSVCVVSLLTRVTKGSRSIIEFLHTIQSLLDELATVGSLVSNFELIVKILSGVGPKFREIYVAIHACDTAISYEELFEKLLDYELFLRHEDA
ncbi:hypothetical protein KY284_033323 [Solanum tuberosum]|nr:hypothetical protein KY284_033323 [Solanum tuberosum]